MDDTIYALASAPGRAGIAVVRISGPQAGPALLALCRRTALPAARRLTRVDLIGRDGTLLDRGLAAWFPTPRSFTGEDVVELHVHGGRAVLQASLRALAELPGLRLAQPGEFTRRAFEADKLDLTAAEGLADLVNAETEAQRRQALRQLDGALGELYEGWRVTLLRVLAHLEADIDFPDEDLPDGLPEAARAEIEALQREIGAHLADGHRGERLRDGLSIVILGAPNVGKSSLLNYLAGRDAAIVAASAGTTRDVIEVHMDFGGFPAVIADTAGLRESRDPIEQEGIRRARARAAAADFKVVMIDARDWPAIPEAARALLDENALLVVNKTDLAQQVVSDAPGNVLPVSVVTGAGMAELLRSLQQAVEQRMDLGPNAALTQARHRQALEGCLASLDRSLAAPTAELRAEDIRLAARAMGQITGRVDIEDVLDAVFREFCIGK